MDEEAKQLLREIRDIAVREEAKRKRLVRTILAIVAILLCAAGYLFIQIERLMHEPPVPPHQAAQ